MNKELEKRINFVSAQIPRIENGLKMLTANQPKDNTSPYFVEFKYRGNSDTPTISIPESNLGIEFNKKVIAELEICRDRIIRLYEKHLEELKKEYDEL